MVCAQCATPNPDEARFCSNCGAQLERRCTYCGAILIPGAKYCQNCPRPVSAEHQARLEPYLPRELHTKLEAARAGRAMEGERRIVTMLFCDVKDSTAMAVWETVARTLLQRLPEPLSTSGQGADGTRR